MAVLGPLWFGIDSRIVRDSGQLLSRQVLYIDVQVAVARGQHQRQLLSVRRPRRRLIHAGLRRYDTPIAGFQGLHIHCRQSLLERNIGQTRAIRRPRWRHQRLARLHHDMRVFAVGVRDDELIGLVGQMPQHRDVSNARGECAADTQDFFKHGVGDLMTRGSQAGTIGANLKAQQALLGEHVIQLVSDVIAIGAVRLHRTHDHVVVVEPAPVIESDIGAGVRLLDHVLAVHGLEAAAARQIVAHQLRDIERSGGQFRRRERHDGNWNGFRLTFRDLDDKLAGVRKRARPRQHEDSQTGKQLVHG